MKRVLYIGLLVGLLSLLLAVPVLAAYYITISVTESNGTSYDMLVCNVTLDVDYLADNGFINANGTDVRVKNSGGSELPFMLAEDRVLFASAVAASKTTGLELTTGNTPLDSFAVVTGHEGYVTTADNANLELGNNFSIEFDGWLNPDVEYGPTVVASASSTEDTQVTSHSVDLPNGIKSGDLLLMLFNIYDPDAGFPIITWPSGWTELDQGTQGSYHCDKTGAAYRVADGTENSTVIVTTGSDDGYSSHQTFRITHYLGVPTISSQSEACSNAPNSANLASGFGLIGEQNILWFTFFGGEDADISVSSYPTNYDDGQTLTKSSAGVSSLGSARRTTETATENPGSFTLSNTICWVAYTIGIEGSAPSLIYKEDAFRLYFDDDEDLVAYIDGGSPKTLTNADMTSGEYLVEVYADGTTFYLDIDGSTKNSTALAGASVPNNANNWTLAFTYADYYKHSVNGTLIAWYQPTAIISDAILPDRQGAAQNGTITWGNNPEGISIALSGLQVEEEFYYTGGAPGDTEDIFEPEPAALISGVDLEKLSHHPLAPLVNGIAQASGGLLPASILWIGGAWFILIGVGIALIVLVREHLVFAAAVSMGLAIMFYLMGIFDYWVLIVLGILLGASIVHERTPTW